MDDRWSRSAQKHVDMCYTSGGYKQGWDEMRLRCGDDVCFGSRISSLVHGHPCTASEAASHLPRSLI